MIKREFVKMLGLGTLGTVGLVTGIISCSNSSRNSRYKNWAWVHPVEPSEQVNITNEWKRLLLNLKKWGVDSVLLLAREK